MLDFVTCRKTMTSKYITKTSYTTVSIILQIPTLSAKLFWWQN